MDSNFLSFTRVSPEMTFVLYHIYIYQEMSHKGLPSLAIDNLTALSSVYLLD